ncbi:MAG: hypothetical protein KGI38_12325 [Thaumarchaeota archaeon]|nr:hypothetical protein [Nitrososphaerota archaeon]
MTIQVALDGLIAIIEIFGGAYILSWGLAALAAIFKIHDIFEPGRDDALILGGVLASFSGVLAIGVGLGLWMVVP